MLNKEHTDLVTTGKVTAKNGERYGYGFIEKNENEIRHFGHSGGAIGINTELRIYPESGYVVVALGNYDRRATAIVANFIGEILFSKNVKLILRACWVVNGVAGVEPG